MTISITTKPGRYVINAPHDVADDDPRLTAAVAEAKAMAKPFGYDVAVVKAAKPKTARRR